MPESAQFTVDPIALDRLRLLAENEGRSLEDAFSEAVHAGVELLLTGSVDREDRLRDVQAAVDDLITLVHLMGPTAIATNDVLVRWSAAANPGGPSEDDYRPALAAEGRELWASEVGRYGIVVPVAPADMTTAYDPALVPAGVEG